jgi:hypothetical protein
MTFWRLFRRDVHFPPHRLKDRFQRLSSLSRDLSFQLSAVHVRFGDGVQLDVSSHCLEEGGRLKKKCVASTSATMEEKVMGRSLAAQEDIPLW